MRLEKKLCRTSLTGFELKLTSDTQWKPHSLIQKEISDLLNPHTGGKVKQLQNA